MVRRVLRVMRPALSQHRVARRLPAGLPPVEADPLAIEHILRNLLDNAAHYAPPGSLVTVAARADGPWVRLSVSDRGPGIAPAERERVFAPYVRLEPGASRGAGLGLAICRRLAESQGGAIQLEGRRSGPGLTVAVAFPVARE
jgi:two-component system sensor histidine kinase KdpD